MRDTIAATELTFRSILPARAVLRRVGHAGTAKAGIRATVAVPAKDEQRRIGVCLESLAAACARREAEIVVLVNNSSDATFARALGRGAALGLTLTVAEVVLPPHLAHAGAARGVAMDAASRLARPGAALMTTDADARVAPDWIAANCAELARGAALVCGRIEMEPIDAEALPAGVKAASAQEQQYLELMRKLESLIDPDPWNPWPHHGRCSGASMAVTSARYAAVGGLPRTPCGEDRAFLQRFREHDLPAVFADAARVVVSGRTTGRAPGGMADAVAARITDPNAPIDSFGEPALDWAARLKTRALARRLHRSGAGLLALCHALDLAPAAARAACGATAFGAAWARIEAASRFRSRRLLRPSQLAPEIARLQAIIAAFNTANRPLANEADRAPLQEIA